MGSEYKTFKIDKNTLVYLDNERAKVDDLVAGMPVIVRHKGDTALRIQAESVEGQVDGVITNISDKDDTITVKVGSSYKTFSVNRNTEIKVNGQSAGFNQLTVNMNVTVRHRAELALKIRAQNNVTDLEGVITTVGTLGERIRVKSGGNTIAYSVSDADIYVEGESADIEDLVVGMTAELKLVNGDTVVEVNAELEEVEGIVVTSLDDDDTGITLRLYGTNVTYELDQDVEVEFDDDDDDDDDDLEDVERGDRVVLEFEDGLVVLIKVN